MATCLVLEIRFAQLGKGWTQTDLRMEPSVLAGLRHYTLLHELVAVAEDDRNDIIELPGWIQSTARRKSERSRLNACNLLSLHGGPL